LKIHYTLKHESWLDITEIELNVTTIQCLSRRIYNIKNTSSSTLHKNMTVMSMQPTSNGNLLQIRSKQNWHYFILNSMKPWQN